MKLEDAIILGVIQGLTEFLPVSSSGHLTLGKALLGINEKGILFEVVVHLGTLFAVVTAFWPDIVWLLTGFIRLFKQDSPSQEPNPKEVLAGQYIAFLIWGTIPAVIVGLFFKDYFERAFSSPLLASVLLLVTGTILLLSRLGLNAKGGVTLKRSVIVGAAQAFAILPGISRSGTTISVGMLCGIRRDEAARFSFLLAIPAIAGAFLLQLKDAIKSPPTEEAFIALLAGFVVSYLSGYLAIRFLMSLVRRGRLDYFAWYCYLVGLLGIYFLQFA